ncbi:MAG TPA: condensation domain-containing protein, partial [Pseudonocardiaceae bacterium]
MTVQPQAPDRRQELLRARLAKARARRPEGGLSTAPSSRTIPRRPDQAPVTLSYPQRRLWFLAQYEPDSPANNIPLAARLSGELDRDALVGALEQVVARHEVLRTSYPTLDGEPAPVVEPAGAFQVDTVELEPAEVDGWLDAHARRPFDLACELPVRAVLLRTGEREHVLSVVLHHIAADGWSIGVLADELAAGYAALRAGGQPRLPELPELSELPVQYADIAHWQAGTALQGQLAWWTDALRGAPATVTVPTDRPRPAVASTRGRRITVGCGPDRSARIRGLAAEVGATPFVVLLAALQTVLHRYTGSDDVVVGSPIAGRTHSEMEPLIGCFVNTLALRTDLSGEPTVRELLARVRETTFCAFGHQDLPFERLVDALHPERDLSHTPLFQVMLNVHNQPQPALQLPGLVAEWTDTATETAKFDVSIAVVDRPGEQLDVDLVWRTDLYDEATIRRLYGHLVTVLDGMAADPDAPLSSLPLLTAGEVAELAAWNATAQAYPVDGGTLHGMIERQAALTPDAVAVVGADATLSYAELDGRANRVAHELVRLGVAPGRPVGLFADRGAGLIVGMLGILKAGGAYLPLDPVYPDHRVRELLAAAGAAAVVTSGALAA